MRSLAAAILLPLAAACAGSHEPAAPVAARPTAMTAASAPAPAVPVPPDPRVLMTATEDPANDRWRVELRLPQPVMGIAFGRQRNRFRAKRWTAEADGGSKPVEWTVRSNGEAVVAKGREPFTSLVLSFATDTEEKTADYLLNAAFSDGSRLFYTGYFAATLLVCPGAEPCAAGDAIDAPRTTAQDVRWQFRTKPDRHIIVLDDRRLGELEWAPRDIQPEQGTYVLFGNLVPVETERARIVFDPGMPAWMVDSAKAFMPKALDWFAKDTSIPLSFRPLVLVSFGGTSSRGRSAKGGGLDRLVQLSTRGDGWTRESAETRVGWLSFVAHELFHLWNGGMFRRRRPANESWLSEGSSDYFAFRALRALDVIDDAAYRQLVVRSANECLVTLYGRPLAGFKGSERPEYTCGATALAWIDGLARAKQETIGAVLGRVLVASRQAGSKYGTEDVLAEAGKIASDTRTVDALRRLLDEGVKKDGGELFAEQLRAAGIDVRLVPLRDAEMDSDQLVSLAGIELARCDCVEGRVAFNTRNEGYDFNDVPQCSVLKGVRVVAVEGHAVPKDGAKAFEALVTRKPNAPIFIRLENAKAPQRLSCRTEPPPPPFKRLLR